MRKVLIANRGEIAVRVIRACKDAGLTSVAVYADSDRDALPARLADEAYALGGETAADTYLRIDKLLDVAARSGADAVHPGYGFLSENADFAQAVIDAGLTWIGPTPQAIRDLGDKVTARHIAQRAGAPLVPGTAEPVADADEIVAFAQEHGLPVAIKAAFGGGGRGLKVARTIEEIPSLFESATREAVAAFGRGECFVERYLDRPRHVEAQVLADTHGNVIVVGTRDCSLQRRHQKLVEEAPAPFLTDEQRAQIHESAKAICREAGYHGAGTVEYLVGQDGTISFLEVNTRLQVEHPVSEETAGIDLVRAQFRIAAGDAPGDRPRIRRRAGTPSSSGSTARIPAATSCPRPARSPRCSWPAGPGVRVDAGRREPAASSAATSTRCSRRSSSPARPARRRSNAPGACSTRRSSRASPRSCRSTGSVVRDPAFADDLHRAHPLDRDRVGRRRRSRSRPRRRPAAEAAERETVVVEVGGKRLEVSLPTDLFSGTRTAGCPPSSRRAGVRPGRAAAAPAPLH